MIYYYFPLIPLLVGALMRERKFFIGYKYLCGSDAFFLYVFLIFIFILTGFKGNIDPDYLNYKIYYDLIPGFDSLNEGRIDNIKTLTSHVEPAIIYGMSALKTLGLGFQYFYIVSSAFFVFFIYKLSIYFKGQECLVGLVLYCFYLQPFFIQVRYFIGVLCGLICIMEYMRKEHISKKFIVYFIVGLLFHTVIVFSLPIVFYKIFKGYLLKYIYISLLLPISLLFINIDYLLQFTPFISERYVNYMNVANEQNVGNIFSFIVRESLVLFLITLLYISNRFSFSSTFDNEKSKPLFLMIFMMLVVWAFAWRFGMLYRIALLFEFGWLFFLIQKKKDFYFFFCAIIISSYMLIRLYTGLSELAPFKFADEWAY